MAHMSVRQLGHCPAGWWAGLRNYYPLAELGAVGRLSYLNHHRQQKLRSVLRGTCRVSIIDVSLIERGTFKSPDGQTNNGGSHHLSCSGLSTFHVGTRHSTLFTIAQDWQKRGTLLGKPHLSASNGPHVREAVGPLSAIGQ